MERLTLSVVLPNYNHAHYLPRALNALLSQSRLPDEILIADDASTDDSLAVLEKYARLSPLVKIHRNPDNLGMLNNNLQLFRMAQGDVVYAHGADDYILPGMIENAMAMSEAYSQAALCCWDSYSEVEGSPQTWEVAVPGPGGYLRPDALAERLRHTRFPLILTNALVRRQRLLETGVLWPEAEWNFDWMASTLLAFRYGAVLLPGRYNVFLHREQGLSKSNRFRIREPLRLMLTQINSPEWADVRKLVARSQMFAYYYLPESLEMLIRNPRDWDHLDAWLWILYLRIRISREFPALRKMYQSLRKLPQFARSSFERTRARLGL